MLKEAHEEQKDCNLSIFRLNMTLGYYQISSKRIFKVDVDQISLIAKLNKTISKNKSKQTRINEKIIYLDKEYNLTNNYLFLIDQLIELLKRQLDGLYTSVIILQTTALTNDKQVEYLISTFNTKIETNKIHLKDFLFKNNPPAKYNFPSINNFYTQKYDLIKSQVKSHSYHGAEITIKDLKEGLKGLWIHENSKNLTEYSSIRSILVKNREATANAIVHNENIKTKLESNIKAGTATIQNNDFLESETNDLLNIKQMMCKSASLHKQKLIAN